MVGTGLNIAGTATRAAGVDGQFGMDVLGAWGNYFMRRMNARLAMAQADAIDAEAGGRLRDAGTYNATAGSEQRTGLDEAALRTRQLGEDIGRIYAGAAAGNIDVGASRTVREVDSASRIMAGQDVETIGANAAARAGAYQAQAQGARADAGRIAARGEMQRIQARYQRRVAKSQFRMDLLSAAGGWMSGHAANAASMMGGF